MKLIDFDEKFNARMAREIERHAGTRTEEEWENEIAAQYARFGQTPLKELNGQTPRQYFAQMSDEQLVETLKEYLLQDVSVPDFLCEELEGRAASPAILALLSQTDEELVLYALNVIGDDPRALGRYAEMLGEEAYDEHVKDAIADLLKGRADDGTEPMLALLGTENEAYALEVLSGTRRRDERVFRALTDAFLGADEGSFPLYAGYLAAYGDERALPQLLAAIEREDIGFVAFQELKFAIEALGGAYDKERDFSADESYKKIMEAGAGTDIFGGGRR